MKLKMEDGRIVNTDKNTGTWEEETDWNGNNHISRSTGSQWDHETLYRSAKREYYIVSESQMQGVMTTARWITNEEAAKWIELMDRTMPAELQVLEASE